MPFSWNEELHVNRTVSLHDISSAKNLCQQKSHQEQIKSSQGRFSCVYLFAKITEYTKFVRLFYLNFITYLFLPNQFLSVIQVHSFASFVGTHSQNHTVMHLKNALNLMVHQEFQTIRNQKEKEREEEKIIDAICVDSI